MKIHGREVHFLLTVGATKKIANLCPDKDIQNIGLVFSNMGTDQMIDAIAIISSAMSDGYEKNQRYKNPDYICNPITEDEVMCMTMKELSELQNELMKEIGAGMEVSITAEEEKTKGKKKGEEIQSS